MSFQTSSMVLLVLGVVGSSGADGDEDDEDDSVDDVDEESLSWRYRGMLSPPAGDIRKNIRWGE